MLLFVHSMSLRSVSLLLCLTGPSDRPSVCLQPEHVSIISFVTVYYIVKCKFIFFQFKELII